MTGFEKSIDVFPGRKVIFVIRMKSDRNIRKFQYEGPSQVKCVKNYKNLRCSWIPEKGLWNLKKIDFCFTAFVRDARFSSKSLIRKSLLVGQSYESQKRLRRPCFRAKMH